MKLKPRMGFKRLGLLITLIVLLTTYFYTLNKPHLTCNIPVNPDV